MYISELSIRGYKNAHKQSVIHLNKGLNILLGENGCGKTTVINALRLLLREPEMGYSFGVDDFYNSLDRSIKDNSINIDAAFVELSEDEKLIFLTWCDADFNAQLHVQLTENSLKPGNLKRRFWGGKSMASIFEDDTFDRVECIYLPPLRDAEAKLSNGRRSRLVQLLKKKYGDNTEGLVESVKQLNETIAQNKDGKHSEIGEVKTSINNKIQEALGHQLGQSVDLLFSETSFNRIIENIKLVFFPHTNETDLGKFRELATNSLGYNNLLYIATVFSELELIKGSDVFTVLLIEEPEAHLHPQLQVKFIKYIETLSETLPNAQIVVSTHSPVLASSVGIDKLIHLHGLEDQIISTTISQKVFQFDNEKKYINRWMDVTKSTMLFSRGVILVEGIAEALLIPELARIVLKKYNDSHRERQIAASSLEEMGVSVINIGGINFKYFMKLFGNFDGSSGPSIPLFCAGITDRDPEKDAFPKPGEDVKGDNPVLSLLDQINDNDKTKLFVSPFKTLEYDLAIYNPVTMATVLKSLWSTDKGKVNSKLNEIISRNNGYGDDKSQLSEDAQYIYKYIDDKRIGKGIYANTLIEVLDDSFVVPDYIRKAVLWACGGIAI